MARVARPAAWFPLGAPQGLPGCPNCSPKGTLQMCAPFREVASAPPQSQRRHIVGRSNAPIRWRLRVRLCRDSVSALLCAGAVRLVSSGVRVWVCTALAVLSFKLVPGSEAQSQSRPVRGACRSWAPGRGPQRVLASSGGRSCSFISPRLASLWGDGCPLQQGWSRSSRRCWALGVGSP